MNNQDINELCNYLKESLDGIDNQNHEVKFTSGLKPFDYYLPQMHIGTTATIPTQIQMAWFCEIRVDGKCIFMESWIPKESEDLSIVEAVVIKRLMRSVFNYGVMASKKVQEEFIQHR